ncbi:MAG TPA: helix-turn-helix domain-containing protein [Pyrinomonadaceae bacterium]|nr:helix-turn-helix domain-containing protein [Pyrinomonadaceae bacterium]
MKDEPPRDDSRDRYVTARQLAAVLQVSESTVRRLAREGRIPCVRLTTRLLRFHLPSVSAALEPHDDAARPAKRPRPNAADNGDDYSQLSFPGLFEKQQ